ncbi:MAG: pyridoxal kinase [Pseudomonadota bacterium]
MTRGARVLAISSWVGVGHVGLSAIAPAIQRVGGRCAQLPTIMLSNHPGFAHAAGSATPPETLRRMIEAMAANGFLDGLDAVLTGYMPSAAHADAAAEFLALARTRSPAARVLVDPVIGDAPKGLYAPATAAEAIRDRLAPEADLITPNHFELGWLSGAPTDTLDAAREAAEGLRARFGVGGVIVTSAPFPEPQTTGLLVVDRGGARAFRTPLRIGAPHGVGDVLSGLLAAGLETGSALGKLQTLIETSLGRPHLALEAGGGSGETDWSKAAPIPGAPL